MAWRRFAAGQNGASQPVRIRRDDAVLTADIKIQDDAFLIFVDPNRSNPRHHQQLLDDLDSYESGGPAPTFEIEGRPRFITERARASQLRDAYVAAFALLGYRYILWPDLDDTRQAIAHRDAPAQPHWRTDLFGDRRVLLTLSRPVEAVAAIVDGDVTFLPWPNYGKELTEWLATWGGGTSELAGKWHPWPTGMPMMLDLPVETQ